MKSGNGWMLIPSRHARDRAEDLEEVRTMIEEGEIDIAIDELRWLLDGSNEFIEAHSLLGELALSEDNDVELARAHFGFAYQTGMKALRRAKMPTPLPYRLKANRAFFESGKGLAWCLGQLDKPQMAVEVLETLLSCDPDSPLGLAEMLDGMKARGGGKKDAS